MVTCYHPAVDARRNDLEPEPAVPVGQPRTSTRDPQSLQAGLGRWLDQRVEADDGVLISLLGRPSGAGLSSETLLFDASWMRSAVEVRDELVLRLPPPTDAF